MRRKTDIFSLTFLQTAHAARPQGQQAQFRPEGHENPRLVLDFNHLYFEIISDFEFMSINYPTLSAAADLAHFRHIRHFKHLYPLCPSTTVEIALQIHSILTNKPNFRNDKMNIKAFITMRYGNLDTLIGQKTKPIQTQFKPIKAKINSIKANSNPIQTQFRKVNGLDNNLCNWYINPSEFLYGQIVKIGKRNI